MEASILPSPQIPSPPQFEPDAEKIKRKLIQRGVNPTPKIIRTLRKKEIQKHNRKTAKQSQTPPLSPFQLQALAEKSHFQTLKREYKRFNRAINGKTTTESSSPLMLGKPWERIERVKLLELASGDRQFDGESLKRDSLEELREMFEKDLQWVLDDDVEVEDEDWLLRREKRAWDPAKRWRNEKEAIRVLVDRLSEREITEKHWKFVRIMKQSGLQFTEERLLRIVKELGEKESWRQAMSVVAWVYGNKEHTDFKSRFVYTRLLSVLGKARRPQEALQIFNLMLGDRHIYPDMAAYHSIAVTLGQAGLLKELIHVIDCMRQKPSKKIKNARQKNWDPLLEPDVVVYNAVLNACIPVHQWKGVSWVFEQLRKHGLRPNGATYGLAMEVMLRSGKYDLVHEFFGKMKRSGQAPKALTYRVLVKAFWEEGRVNEAVEAVRDMEQRGVVGTASVYYELACCLCNNRRWQDAMTEIDKMKKLRHRKPLEITFTGLIMASLDGGHVDNCISIFQHMKEHCVPNIGAINAMLKAYGRNDMFSKAKQLFEEIKEAKAKAGPCTSLDGDVTSRIPDEYTYSLMLEASASALQWEYFECVYKEMALSGYLIDQNKHAVLLVEASRAGKWHLLEHAFDTFLEAGEVPHQLFFYEMIIQAIAQSDYERAINLVNGMAYAPFQISEKQWTDLLEKNGERITWDNLEELLDTLCNCKLSSEATASNLISSLKSLCGSAISKNFSSFGSVGSEGSNKSLNSNNEEIYSNTRVTAPSTCADMMGGHVSKAIDPPVKAADVTFDVFAANHSESEEDDADIEMVLLRSLNYVTDDNNLSQTCTKVEHFADDDVAGELINCSEEKLSSLGLNRYSKNVDEAGNDLAINMGDARTSKVPSASEILEAWKKSRKNDGVFSAFQLGLK